jgi:hypothetical protein
MKYKNQLCALTTKHSKSKAIAEPFSIILGLQIIECNENTDQLGTFSGELERTETIFEVLRKKCELGMEASGLTLGIASEGSFGPHPSLFFLPCDHEELIFIDKEKDFYLRENVLSLETNYKFKDICYENEFLEFANAIKFPSHGIIIRPADWVDKSIIFKGIQSVGEFKKAFHICKKASSNKMVRVESDMRAHMNPTRMAVIGQLAEKLAHRLSILCPKCKLPGWGLVRLLKGLECTECDFPTEKIKEEIFGCVKCDFEESFRKALNTGPENCPICNP